jgi:hypothetical protein
MGGAGAGKPAFFGHPSDMISKSAAAICGAFCIRLIWFDNLVAGTQPTGKRHRDGAARSETLRIPHFSDGDTAAHSRASSTFSPDF